jgi:hypothetical protein
VKQIESMTKKVDSIDQFARDLLEMKDLHAASSREILLSTETKIRNIKLEFGSQLEGITERLT